MGQDYALLSVTDKTGIVDFGATLIERGYRLLSTGGTFKELQKAGLEVTDIETYTGQKEMFGGRVKTLHPKIFAGILQRGIDDMQELARMDWNVIRVVCVNLYAFEKETSSPDVWLSHAIENVDIGGPSLIRAAAKNYEHTLVVTSPDDYADVKANMTSNGGVSRLFRYECLKKAFARTAAYDAAISAFFNSRKTD